MKTDSDEKGHYTESVSFDECIPYIEAAIKEHKTILCYVYNSYEKPAKCEQAFVIAYDHNNARGQHYICTNGYNYKYSHIWPYYVTHQYSYPEDWKSKTENEF